MWFRYCLQIFGHLPYFSYQNAKNKQKSQIWKKSIFSFFQFRLSLYNIGFASVFIIELSLDSEIFDLRTRFLTLLWKFEILGFWPNLPLWDIDGRILGTTWYLRNFFFQKFSKKYQNSSEIKWFGLKPIRTDFIARNVKKSPKIGVCPLWEWKG